MIDLPITLNSLNTSGDQGIYVRTTRKVLYNVSELLWVP